MLKEDRWPYKQYLSCWQHGEQEEKGKTDYPKSYNDQSPTINMFNNGLQVILPVCFYTQGARALGVEVSGLRVYA